MHHLQHCIISAWYWPPLPPFSPFTLFYEWEKWKTICLRKSHVVQRIVRRKGQILKMSAALNHRVYSYQGRRPLLFLHCHRPQWSFCVKLLGTEQDCELSWISSLRKGVSAKVFFKFFWLLLWFFCCFKYPKLSALKTLRTLLKLLSLKQINVHQNNLQVFGALRL